MTDEERYAQLLGRLEALQAMHTSLVNDQQRVRNAYTKTKKQLDRLVFAQRVISMDDWLDSHPAHPVALKRQQRAAHEAAQEEREAQ